MLDTTYAFPWGVYIGDLLVGNNTTLPVCLPSTEGGFCLLFDDESELVANNLVENAALKLFEVLPIGDIVADIFDFSYKKRFMHLSSLHNDKLYDIALTPNDATTKFNELEKIALYRHHNLLSFQMTTISDYNQSNKFRETYHLLLINLEHYPDDLSAYRRIKEFFESAYEAGFYCIAFGIDEVKASENKAAQYLLNKFPVIEVKNKKVWLNKTVFPFIDHVDPSDFDYVNDNKDFIIEKLLTKLHQGDETDTQKDFLTIPIGTSPDGRSEVYFKLGEKTGSYHAFITGVAGSGKTTLLNNMILHIAQRHTSEEIRLYLMDYKEGVEFQVFKNHPNCKKIFLDNEDLQASIDLLEEFVAMIKERSHLFKQHEVKDITQYNTLQSSTPMYRIILVIDEVHRLFSGDYKQKAYFSDLLKQVVRQGRAFGVHIILSTQTLRGTEIDAELMSQITLRISYKLTDPRDSEMIFTYGNTDALRLGKYELIYNNDSGYKEANVLCRVNPPKDIKSTIDEIIKTRDKNLILKPVIAQSANTEEVKTDEPVNTFHINTLERDDTYGVDAEKAALEKVNKLISGGV